MNVFSFSLQCKIMRKHSDEIMFSVFVRSQMNESAVVTFLALLRMRVRVFAFLFFSVGNALRK